MAIEYRAYTIGRDDRIMTRVDLFCDDDDTAKEHAKQLVDGHAVELWRGDRLLARFEPPQ